MRTFFLLVAGWLTILSSPTLAVQTPIVVIVSPTNSITTLKRTQLIDLFLKRVSRFPDGKAATPRDQANGPSKENFYQTFFDYSQEEIRDYWIREIYEGGKHPPDFTDTRDDAAMKRWIAQKPAGIGYIHRSSLDDTVREVSIAP